MPSIRSLNPSGSDIAEPQADARAIYRVVECVDPIRRCHPALTTQSRDASRTGSRATCIRRGSDISEPRAYPDLAGSISTPTNGFDWEGSHESGDPARAGSLIPDLRTPHPSTAKKV